MRTDILDRREEILKWIKEGQSIAEIIRRLNCKRETFKSYLKQMGITYNGNQGGKGIKIDPKRKSALEILDSSSFTNATKRKRLIEDGIKEAKCECCGLSEWMGKPILLELHHKDFNHNNNTLENIAILCSNCHMVAHNYNNNFSK